MNFNLPVTDNKDKAQAALNAAVSEYGSALCELVKYALTNNLYLYIDGHGELLLEEDEYSYKGRGDWYTSTDSCS